MIKTFEEFVKSLTEKKKDDLDILNQSDDCFSPEVPEFKPEVYSEISIDNHEDKVKKEGKEIAGLKEVIEIVGLGKMRVKLDSGNTTRYNALIVQDFKESDGKVKFKFKGKEKEYDVVKHIRVWHHGKSTERPVIRVDIKFNGKVYKDELIDLKISDLTGTKNYRCRMLLCKDFMTKAKIVIDPSKEFKLTDKDDLKKRKKKIEKKG